MRRQALIDVARVVAIALCILTVSAILLDIRRLHISAIGNDQVSYIGVARNLHESGRLYSNIIYPSQLNVAATKDYFYMPGYYYVLATCFRVFGVGDIAAQLPSLLAFVATSVATYGIGTALHGRLVGLVAAVMFALTPFHIFFACSAMSDLTVVMAAALSLWVFIMLPQRWRWAAGPFLLIPPFLCRETNAFLVLSMLPLVDAERSALRWARRAALLVASAIVLGSIYVSPLSAGRPSLFHANVLDGSFEAVYNDAFRIAHINASLQHFVVAMVRKAVDNCVNGYFGSFLSRPLAVELWQVTAVIAITVWASTRALKRGHQEPTAAAAASFPLATLVFLFFCYKVMDRCGVRLLMAASPMLDVFLAHRLLAAMAPNGQRDYAVVQGNLKRLAVVACSLLLLFLAINRSRLSAIDHYDEECLAFFESIGHDDRTVLVSSSSFAFPYIASHYPVRWSFIPANRETLEQLEARYNLGTIVFQLNDPVVAMTPEDVESLGWKCVRVEHKFFVTHLVYKRSDHTLLSDRSVDAITHRVSSRSARR